MNCDLDQPILFFDSGIGGLPYLSNLRDKIPNENFVYVADSKNFPYGEKSTEELIGIITVTVEGLIKKFDPKVVVIACNTASVTALNQIRESSQIPIVGVVPAVKTASEQTRNCRIGVLATKKTVDGDYLEDLILKFSNNSTVVKVGASGIVDFVENEFYHSTKQYVSRFISDSVKELKQAGVDSVVLGCTHFIHVANEIKAALGDGVNVIDSREGVSNQVLRVMGKSNETKKSKSLFYLTSKLVSDKNYRFLCKNMNLEYKGELYG